MKDLNNWLKEAYLKVHTTELLSSLKNFPDYMSMQSAERLICLDGFSVSIQAGSSYYCSPRTNFNVVQRKPKQYYYGGGEYRTVKPKDVILVDYSIYEQFELGFPSMPDDLIKDFAEDQDNLTDTVYPYVPRLVVEHLLASHGGVIAIEGNKLLSNNG